MGRTASTEPQCLYKGALYLYLTVELYLYSPYRPYGLYRASVPVQGCTLPFTVRDGWQGVLMSGAFAKLQKQVLASSNLLICLSVRMENSAPTERIFMKFDF